MNVDHFFFIDKEAALSSSSSSSSIIDSSLSSPRLQLSSHHSTNLTILAPRIDNTLLAMFKSLSSPLPPPRKGKKKRKKNKRKKRKQNDKERVLKYEDYSIINVSPSLIPIYLPTLRIWTYNVSRDSAWEQGSEDAAGREIDEDEEDDEEFASTITTFRYLFTYLSNLLAPSPISSSTPQLHSLIKKPKPPKTKPKLPPRYNSPASPSRTNRFLSPLGFTQLCVDLQVFNQRDGFGPSLLGNSSDAGAEGEEGRREPEWAIEYTTYTASSLAQSILTSSPQPAPIPTSLYPSFITHYLSQNISSSILSPSTPAYSLSRILNWFRSEVGEDKERLQQGLEKLILAEGRLTPIQLVDWTIPTVIEWAKAIGKSQKKWEQFKGWMYVGTESSVRRE
jgi:endopolyphosphatase